MGLGDLLKKVGDSAIEKYNDKQNEVQDEMRNLKYEDNERLFEILYRSLKSASSMKLFSSESMAARKTLINRGYSGEEIDNKVKQMYRQRNR